MTREETAVSNRYPEEGRAKPEWEKIRREVPEFVEDVVAAAVRGYRKGKQRDGVSPPPAAEAVVISGEREVTIPVEPRDNSRQDVVSVLPRRSPATLIILVAALLVAALVLSLAFNVIGFVFTLLSVVFGFLSGLFKVLAGLKGLAMAVFFPVAVIAIVLFVVGRFQRR